MWRDGAVGASHVRQLGATAPEPSLDEFSSSKQVSRP